MPWLCLYSSWRHPVSYFPTEGTVKQDTLKNLNRSCLDIKEKSSITNPLIKTRDLAGEQGSNNLEFFCVTWKMFQWQKESVCKI